MLIFKTRYDMELLFAACNLAKYGDLKEAQEKNEIVADTQFLKILTEMHESLSNFIRHELEIFFGNIAVQLAFFTYALEKNEAGSIDDLINRLNSGTAAEMLSYFVQAFAQTCLSGKVSTFDRDRYGSIEDMLLYIVKQETKELETKALIEEFLANPEETKQRYCFMLKSIYDNLYKKYETIICSCLENARIHYEGIYMQDRYNFFMDFLNMDPYSFDKSLEMHISCFLQVSLLIIQSNAVKTAWIGFGSNNEANLKYKKSVMQESLQKLFKILSEKTRFDMLLLLKERPWYNQEISDKLGITQSTVNHHFSALLELGLVKMERDNHRMYYSLQKDRLKELLDTTYTFLQL